MRTTDIDKVSLGYAAIFGLIQDLNLKGNQYAWTNSIFLAGQLASEFPAIYLMSRLPLARFVGVTVYDKKQPDDVLQES